jgi:Skp family chaperone for outer membrane proteins
MRRRTNLDRVVRLAVVFAVVCAVLPARVVEAQGRLATIEINAVLEKLDERTTSEQELQGYILVLEGRVQGMEQELKSKNEEIQLLPQDDPEYQTTAEDIIRRSFALRAEGELAQALAEKKRKEIQLALFNKISDATGRYAKREGIGIVIANDSTEEIPAGATAQQVQGAILTRKVIWADESLDISGAVASMMNNEYRAGN